MHAVLDGTTDADVAKGRGRIAGAGGARGRGGSRQTKSRRAEARDPVLAAVAAAGFADRAHGVASSVTACQALYLGPTPRGHAVVAVVPSPSMWQYYRLAPASIEAVLRVVDVNRAQWQHEVDATVAFTALRAALKVPGWKQHVQVSEDVVMRCVALMVAWTRPGVARLLDGLFCTGHLAAGVTVRDLCRLCQDDKVVDDDASSGSGGFGKHSRCMLAWAAYVQPWTPLQLSAWNPALATYGATDDDEAIGVGHGAGSIAGDGQWVGDMTALFQPAAAPLLLTRKLVLHAAWRRVAACAQPSVAAVRVLTRAVLALLRDACVPGYAEAACGGKRSRMGMVDTDVNALLRDSQESGLDTSSLAAAMFAAQLHGRDDGTVGKAKDEHKDGGGTEGDAVVKETPMGALHRIAAGYTLVLWATGVIEGCGGRGVSHDLKAAGSTAPVSVVHTLCDGTADDGYGCLSSSDDDDENDDGDVDEEEGKGGRGGAGFGAGSSGVKPASLLEDVEKRTEESVAAVAAMVRATFNRWYGREQVQATETSVYRQRSLAMVLWAAAAHAMADTVARADPCVHAGSSVAEKGVVPHNHLYWDVERVLVGKDTNDLHDVKVVNAYLASLEQCYSRMPPPLVPHVESGAGAGDGAATRGEHGDDDFECSVLKGLRPAFAASMVVEDAANPCALLWTLLSTCWPIASDTTVLSSHLGTNTTPHTVSIPTVEL